MWQASGSYGNTCTGNCRATGNRNAREYKDKILLRRRFRIDIGSQDCELVDYPIGMNNDKSPDLHSP